MRSTEIASHAAAMGGGSPVDPAFESDSGNFSRTTALSYAYADIGLSLLWIVAVIIYTPSWQAFIPGVITGIAAVLIDYVWFYRVGRREVVIDGKAPSQWFLVWWLIFWFEALIAFNIGTYVGLMLTVGLTTTAGMVWTVLFCLWFWILAPTLSRLISDLGYGRQMVTTTRRVGSGLSWGRLGAVFVLHGITYLLFLTPDWQKSLELFAIGMLAASGMEVPLYMLNIRPGRDAWRALLLNTLVEWNYAVPLMFMLFWWINAPHGS